MRRSTAVYRFARWAATPLIVATALALPAGASAAPYIVVLKDGTNAATAAARYGIKPTQIYSSALNGYAADLTSSQLSKVNGDARTSYTQVDSSFAANPMVAGAQSQGSQVASNGVKRIGGLDSRTADIDGRDDVRIDIDVAVIDTGVQVDHPDLNVVGGVDCTGGKSFADQNGHGTMVAGFVGAIDNSFGRVGVAPGARIWSVRVLDKNGSGSNAKVICGVDWVTAHAGTIKVANMSLGGVVAQVSNCGSKPKDALHDAVCKSVAVGVTYIVSAGNQAIDASSYAPAWYPEVITVSGLTDSDGLPGELGGPIASGCGLPDDLDDHFATFSNWGAPIDVAAPASCIGSTYPGSSYAIASGTSFAAPLVAGSAALYISNHPYVSPSAVRSALIGLAEPGPIPGDPDAFGEGVVNVAQL